MDAESTVTASPHMDHPATFMLIVAVALFFMGVGLMGSPVFDVTVAEALRRLRRKFSWLKPGWRWRLFNVVTLPFRLALWLTIFGPLVVFLLGLVVLLVGGYIAGEEHAPTLDRWAAAWWKFWMLSDMPG